MIRNFLFGTLMLLALLSSCTQEELTEEINPETVIVEDVVAKAEFTIDNTLGQVNEKDALQLTNNSENAVSYLWDFDNGDTSTEFKPEYEYEQHGLYNVSLTITDEAGNEKVASQEILVVCLYDNQIHTDF